MTTDDVRSEIEEAENTVFEAEEWIEGAVLRPEIRDLLRKLLSLAKRGQCPFCGHLIGTLLSPGPCVDCEKRLKKAAESARKRLKDIFK